MPGYDIQMMARDPKRGNRFTLLLFENVWAKDMKSAKRNATRDWKEQNFNKETGLRNAKVVWLKKLERVL